MRNTLVLLGIFIIILTVTLMTLSSNTVNLKQDSILNVRNIHTNKIDRGISRVNRRGIQIDSSMTQYVGPGNPIAIGYVPTLTGLVESSILTLTNLKGSGHQLRPEAYNSLKKMSQAFYDEMGESLVVYSSYRSYEYQKNNISKSCKDSGYCAKEGESEHQLGLAVDFWGTEDNFMDLYKQEYNRLQENAHLYGWHQSYQKGKEVDGYHIEPWHRRYLGVELATHLYNNMTFSEFYKPYSSLQ